MVEKLSGNKLFGYVYLPKTERGEVAELATLLDD
jgi:predicted ribonuclease YlaK